MPLPSIRDAAQTIIDLQVHIAELKKWATDFKRHFHATKRGYFTPTEDEKVRHLLIAYWQSRAALFELVIESKAATEQEGLSQNKSNPWFIIGYAGATVLVDAARFLYKTFDDSDVVREKLNEADPIFGIPQNAYDTIQQSLVDPMNVWDLYNANQFYKKSTQHFVSLAKSEPILLKPLKIIDELSDCMDLDEMEYAKTLLQIGARRVTKNIEDLTVNQAMYGLQESVSRAISGVSTEPDHKPSLPAEVRKGLMRLIKPGDVFITRKEGALTNYFLPGYWPHASLYLGHVDGEPSMLEALKDGVRVRSIRSPFSSDAIVVIRPQLTEEQIAEALERGLLHEGKPYDFDFDFKRSDRMVCTEVIYRSYEGIGPIKFKLTSRAGRKNLSAEDLLVMALKKRSFDPVCVFCPDQKKELLTGEAASKTLKKSLG